MYVAMTNADIQLNQVFVVGICMSILYGSLEDPIYAGPKKSRDR
jgi:hypothetical protein